MKGICKRCGKPTTFSWESHCYPCSKEVAKESIVEQIKSGEEDVDTGSSDYVFCPHCGEVLETCYGYDDFPELYEEGEHEIECPECGKTFMLESTCSWYYETRKKDESYEEEQ